ncbi:TetR/AcrR family transcriptional regulator [Nocardiopsis sp. MG754419]|uniref:TetR/AcrR family transcriptional regulator n=1 Tax=Nocardiopsis sp. MG754419 TaxID=2259865 RepID=UPI001BA8A545|nr:TetR/AcrR family transcriptional regulator [Nocardiopsis sp. MG754419]MBR8744096.1 TetR/AcrR family transcriptional regulator [Nocardiopsis sp. MG754419]
MTDTERARSTKGERTRRRIIDAAGALFARSGYRAVSLRDIAARAGLTHAGVLHHFPDKEATLLHVLRRRDEIDALPVLGPGIGHRELIDHLVRIVDRNSRTPGAVALYVHLSAEATDPAHPAHPYFLDRYRSLRALLVPAFAALLDGRPDPSPETAARQFIALQDGLQVQWLLDPDAVDMRAAVVAFLRSLGIAAPDRHPPDAPAPTTGTAPTPDERSV